MDPTEGSVLLDGVDLRDVRFASLRSRVVLVPQEGFLFDATLLENVRFGRPEADRGRVLRCASTELGLDATGSTALPRGLRHAGRPARRVAVGRRAAAGRAGPGLPRRPRPAGARRGDQRGRPGHRGAARSGPSTRLTRGRTSVAIAHRLSTAEAADEVVVVDRGRIVQRGPHARAGRAGRRLRRAARLLGRPAAEPDRRRRRPGTARAAARRRWRRAPRGGRDTAE